MLDTFEQPAAGLGTESAPLLKEEGNLAHGAEVPDLADPIGFHRAGTRAAFPTYDHPRDTREVKLTKRAQQRLERQEPDGRGRLLQMPYPDQGIPVLNRDAHTICGKAQSTIRSDLGDNCA